MRHRRVDLRNHRIRPIDAALAALVSRAAVAPRLGGGPRHEKTFGGLVLGEEPAVKGVAPWCGLCVIDTRNGGVVEWVRLGGTVHELYDVVVLPGVVRPMAFGFESDEIQRILTMGDEGPIG